MTLQIGLAPHGEPAQLVVSFYLVRRALSAHRYQSYSGQDGEHGYQAYAGNVLSGKADSQAYCHDGVYIGIARCQGRAYSTQEVAIGAEGDERAKNDQEAH